MNAEEIIRSTCELCNSGCGVLVYTRDGRPIRVEGDPDNPINYGAICVKGQASLEYLYHPERLKYPLKRAGERGEGKWRRISWDEALDTISAELARTKEKHGAESVALLRGCAKGYQDGYSERFTNCFGTPNVAAMSHVCYQPRHIAATITLGFMPLPDYEYPPACIVLWGLNSAESAIGEYQRTSAALGRGSKLIVIDPWETGYARRANIWVKPRPCSDLALALGMINVIINEGLYDKDFVENWTVGFDRLKANIQDYPPDRVAEITWVPAETIREVARFYATNKPACIAWGNGLDNNINNFQGDRAICILRAITGNLGKPGGDLEWSQSGIVPKYSQEMIQQGAIPPEVRARRLKPRDTIVPPFYYAIPQDIIKAIATGEPYPVRTVFVQGASLLHTYTNSRETYEALKRLDFLTVTDFFMTPTAELADIVLPVATYLEIDSLHLSEYTPTVSVIQKVAQVGECRSDYEILKELAKRLGLGKYFWDDTEQVLDYILKPTGLTYDEFRKVGVIRGSKQYRKHEKSGFSTPSGKVELYSKKLEEWGFDPLPVFHEPPESPYSEPQLAKEYPLVLTNRKLAHFQHSGGRQIQTLRGIHPEPLTYLHPETASKLGIEEGDYVYIETKRGRVKQKAALAPGIDRRVVFLDYGWWFPEKDAELHGWAESNINILTSNKQPYAREMGSATLRGILCKVYKAT